MPFKHDNKEDEKQLVLHRIVSFRCISLHHVRQKKDNKDVIFKSDYLSRQNYTKPKKNNTNRQKAVFVRREKKSCITIIWKQKAGQKNTIIQMKEEEKRADS